jgi:diacylglycerol diphosphate phosphatase/phosphatidate phosphatase
VKNKYNCCEIAFRKFDGCTNMSTKVYRVLRSQESSTPTAAIKVDDSLDEDLEAAYTGKSDSGKPQGPIPSLQQQHVLIIDQPFNSIVPFTSLSIELLALFGVLLLTALIAILVRPFPRTLPVPISPELKFPLQSETVPLWMLVVLSDCLPLIVFFLSWMLNKGRISWADADFQSACLGLVRSVVYCMFLTQVIKSLAGRPRPNFFEMCKFTDKDLKDATTWSTSKCTVSEAIKSYPSGHASHAFSGLAYLSLYLLGKCKVNCSDAKVVKSPNVVTRSSNATIEVPLTIRILGASLPFLLACWIAISRTQDYWHTFSDINAGSLLGILTSAVAYRLQYPSAFARVQPERPHSATSSKTLSRKNSVDQLNSNRSPANLL